MRIIIFYLLLMPFVLCFAQIEENDLDIEINTLIDGMDRLHFQDNNIWFEHFNNFLPGYTSETIYPTTIIQHNISYDWYPEFLIGGEEYQFSEKYNGIEFLQISSVEIIDVEIMPYEYGDKRYPDLIRIIQNPSAANDFHLIIQIDDEAVCCSAWYHFTLNINPSISETAIFRIESIKFFQILPLMFLFHLKRNQSRL